MKTLLVEADEIFQITIPDDAKITFSPWSPPKKDGYVNERTLAGTLRIYQTTKDNIIACFAGVRTFRDISMSYRKQVVKEEGATIWKDDEKGYVRDSKVSVTNEWTNPQLEGEVVKPKRKKKS